MQQEIEAKFLNVDLDKMREVLKTKGAKCIQSNRLMKRVLFDHPDNRFQKHGQTQRLRIRDEGDKVMINFKSINGTNYVDEIETSVGSFDEASNLLKAIGLVTYSFQESKRETWHFKDVEVVLDEWPWLETYIEIEGPSEHSIKKAAKELGFSWDDAKFGSVDTAYRAQYPGITKDESIGDVEEVKFEKPLPEFLRKRMPE